jgi:hypothetical protein
MEAVSQRLYFSELGSGCLLLSPLDVMFHRSHEIEYVFMPNKLRSSTFLPMDESDYHAPIGAAGSRASSMKARR